ncbi:YhgE/Pip domain-containing protein [Marininema halotolerans]|uniref:Putative membrane protein n=1 Tax=Marininema halotolerans TaxID=1155944 RepID=A0A1I6QHA6_9BACL|nr:YhgE/Pip domain-containing protein [Marininema halotolerans]SFS51792.1 putative membrane protein [Marininema halotolerans]
MNIWTVTRTEWLRIFRDKITRLSLIAVIFVPLLYSGLYLYAFWDPYGSLEHLPVALVNEDAGGSKDGKTVQYGKDFVKSMKEDIQLDWHETDNNTAMQGVKGDTYYLVVRVPKDFTEDILSVEGDHPRSAQLNFTLNEGKNYITTQISKRLEGQIREKVSNEFTKEYVQNLLDIVGQSKGGINEAASAANQLADGVEELNDGIQKLKKGTDEASAATKQFTKGTSQLKTGLDKLADGLTKLDKEVSKLMGAAKNTQSQIQGSKKIKQFQTQLATAQKTFDQLQRIEGNIRRDLESLPENYPKLSSDSSYQEVMDQTKEWEDTSENLKTPLDQMENRLPTLLSTAATSGLSQVNQLTSSIHKLAQGANKLEKGADELDTGAKKLDKGMQKLSAGINDLAKGSKKLAAGNRQLGKKLSQAVANSKSPSDKLAPVFAEPVKTKEIRLFPVSQYGTGLAPYFLPLSLWVGSVMTFFVVPIYDARWKLAPHPPSITALGKYLALLPIGLLQALITGLVIHQGLGLPLKSTLAFYGFLMIIAWMSISIIGFLIIACGNGLGRLLSIVVLLLQLISSGGTFPVELLPSSVQAIHPFLPMTYAVNGLRDVIALDNPAGIRNSSLALLAFWLFTLCGWLFFQRRQFRPQDINNPT